MADTVDAKNTEKPGDGYFATPESVRRSYTEEVKAKMGRLDELIGEAHYLSVGNYREQVIREQVERATPRKFSVNTGFVISRRGRETFRSKQMDILVWDSTNFVPVFKASDFVVIRPESLRAAIEVKGVLDHGELKDALDNLESLSPFCDELMSPVSTHERFPFVRFLVAGAVKTGDDGKPILKFPESVWNKLYAYYEKPVLEERLDWCKTRMDYCPMVWVNGIAVVGHGYISAAIDTGDPVFLTYQMWNRVDSKAKPPVSDDSIGLLCAHLEMALSTPLTYARGVVASPFLNMPQLVLPNDLSIDGRLGCYKPREPATRAT